MTSSTELSISIGVESGAVKTNLDKVRGEFAAASAEITRSLQSIRGFADLKRQTEETAKAYGEARKKVAELARAVKAGAGGAALARDFERAKTEAGRLKETLGAQQQRLQQVRAAMSAAGVTTTHLAGQQAALRAQLDATRQKYQDLARVASARDTLKLTPHAEVVTEIAKVKEAYATLASSGKLTMTELAQAKVALRTRIDELQEGTNGWRTALDGVKGGMIEVAAAAAPTVLAIAQAIRFESAMADVKKVIDATPAGFAALRAEILGLTREIPMTANELARIAAAGGQLGIAADELNGFVTVTAKMATAFDMTADEAGSAIGKIKNVYALAIGEVEGLGDTINRLGNTTAAREREIVDVLLRVGGSARQFGLAKEATAALAAAMLSLGKAPEVAATSINTLLNRMQTATMQGGEFQAALGKIGLSAEEMAAMVAQDPQRALDNLLATLARLSGQQRSEVLTGLFGREFQDDIGVLVGSLQTYRDAMEQVADRTAYAGSMNEEFAARAETTENQLRLLKNSVSEAGINLGSVFLPAIRAIIAPITTVLQGVADGAAAFPRLSAAMVTVGTGVVIFGQVAKMAGIAKLAIVGMAAQSGIALGALHGKVVGLGAVFSSLGPLIAAAAAGWTFGTWLTQFDIVKTAGIALAEGLTLAFLKVKQAWTWVTGGDVDAVKREIAEARRIYGDMYLDVGNKAKQAGASQVQAHKDVTEAARQAAGEQQRATGDALKKMQDQYKAYADQVKAAQEDISQRTRTVTERIREMRREEMSDKDAWLDRRKEAEEYFAASVKAKEEGQAALQAGDDALANLKFAEAKEAGDKAISAFSTLKGSVKDGASVFKTSAESLNIATEGMQRAAEVANSASKSQMETAAAAMDGLIAKAGFADLAKGMDEAQQAWLTNWKNMQAQSMVSIAAVEEKIVKMITPERTVWVNVKVRDSGLPQGSTDQTVAGYMRGGPLQRLAAGGGVRNILSGGHLPGWGGGDIVPLMGEPGEVMIRKDSVRAAGLRAALAFNAGRFDVVIAELSKRLKHRIGYQLGGLVGSLPSLPVQHLAAGGTVNQPAAPAKVVEVRFAGGQVHGDERSVEMLLQHLEAAGLSA